MRPITLLPLALASLACLAPARAFACWDGFYVQAERVSFTGEGVEDWSPAQVRALATWTRRLQALVGPGGEVEADMGYASVCVAARCSEAAARSSRPDELFATVATALGASWRARSLALRVTAAPYSVQVAAVRDRAQAEALATRLSELELPHGFVEIGGFPADNREAHVLDAVDATGRPVYRVVVGAFLDRADASAHVAEIARATGLPTLPRAL